MLDNLESTELIDVDNRMMRKELGAHRYACVNLGYEPVSTVTKDTICVNHGME